MKKCVESLQNKDGRNVDKQNSQLLTLSFWEKLTCGKSSRSWCSLSVARNVIAKATEYASFGFSFCILVFHPFYKWLKVTSCKQYRFFSVLTAIILENSNKWPWIGNGEGFAINLSTWANGTKSKWWVSSWLALSNTHKKISIFFHIGCYGFSKGWKSLYNTVVYMIISNFSQASTWTWSILISIH